MNDEKILNEFCEWLNEQAIYVVSDNKEVKREQIDDAPLDYITEFCKYKHYKSKTEEQLLDWIEMRNLVFAFLEENGIK